jgi:hypothetical protein
MVLICFLVSTTAILSSAGCDKECEIENRILEDGVLGQHYEQHLTTTCGGDLSWFLFSEEIPPGLALYRDGVLEGVPELTGTFSFTIGVDRIGIDSDTTSSAAKSYTVTIL